MKKAFGIIFLVAGLVMVILGVGLLSNSYTRDGSAEGRLRDTFNERYHEENREEKAVGGFLASGGFVLFIVGIVMVVSKSSAQRRKEEELAYHRHMQGKTQSAVAENGRKADLLVQQAIAMYNQHEYHPAIVLMQQAKALSPGDKTMYYNLACLYSLTHDTEAFDALSKAIELGYSNFEKINTQRDLEWLRHHPDYPDFVKYGYRIKARNHNTAHDHSGDIYEKLERLAQLKQKGVISEEEFAREKRRMLG